MQRGPRRGLRRDTCGEDIWGGREGRVWEGCGKGVGRVWEGCRARIRFACYYVKLRQLFQLFHRLTAHWSQQRASCLATSSLQTRRCR